MIKDDMYKCCKEHDLWKQQAREKLIRTMSFLMDIDNERWKKFLHIVNELFGEQK